MPLLDSFKPEELAEELRISKGTLAVWRSKGEGPEFKRIAGRIHYMRDDVEKWLDEQIGRPTPAA